MRPAADNSRPWRSSPPCTTSCSIPSSTMLISTTSRPVIRVAKLVGTCAPASVPPILTPASNQRGFPDCGFDLVKTRALPASPFTLSRQLVIRKSKYHGGRGSAEKPLALLDSREASGSLWSDTEPKRDRSPTMKDPPSGGFLCPALEAQPSARAGPQPLRVSYRYSLFHNSQLSLKSLCIISLRHSK